MKKLKKDVTGHIKIGMLSGVGAMGIGAVGGSAAGITTLTGFTPTLSTVQGSAALMRQMKKLKPKKKRGKR